MASIAAHPEMEDYGTDDERLLGRIVSKMYHTDYYAIERYPTACRAFYSMADPADEKWSRTYDFFIRGQEILSGAQRIHDADALKAKAERVGVELSLIADYIDAFKYGAYPHGGCGIGLERFVMLFLNLSNIRQVSMFPRDPKRISP
jgi:aspartyl-tRNA synthetase